MKRCPACLTTYEDSSERCLIDGVELENGHVDALLGHVIEDRYRLDAVIGRGGFGTVYRAAHQRLPRDFAVKVLHAARALQARHLARFKQEVRAAAVLEHPHVLEVIDFGHDARAGYFVVMPLLQGETLLDRMQHYGRLPIADVTPIVLQTTSALQAAHDLGIVHRDIKPENIFLAIKATAPEGFTVKLLDFGIAKVLQEGSHPRLLERGEQPLSEAMQAVGTCLTMSPEQVLGGQVDARADVYGFGCMLFELLTGELPYEGAGGEIMRKHVHDPVPRPSERAGGAWMPPSLDQLLMRLMAKEARDRPQSMHEVAERWEAVRADADEAWADWHLIAHGSRASISPRTGDAPAAAPTSFRTLSGRELTDVLPAVMNVAAMEDQAETEPAAAHHALVIDDDVAIRNLLRLILQNAGWSCSTVDGGPAALQWLRDHPQPSAVVLDMLMPGMDGLAVLKLVRKQGYLGPVVICSTLQSPAIKAEAEAQGGVCFVTKGRELHTIPQVLLGLGLGAA